ncbi:MAG: hypothetical protein HW400_476 [Candidatus Levybacteria bacterium]|nr:hypothetical protein [Candidatus Levybacteria bacterium]
MDEQTIPQENTPDPNVKTEQASPINALNAEPKPIIEKSSDGITTAEKQVENPESSRDIELTLENGRAFGDFYTSMIKSLAGETEMKDIATFGLDEKTQQLAQDMASAINTERGIQHNRMEMKNWGARELLEQIRSDEKAKEILADTSRYRMQEFSKGIYGVFVDADMYDVFASRGSQAVTAKVHTEEGISFVIIKEFKEEQHEQFNKEQLKENIPHEINHLAWFFLEKQGTVATEEQHPEEQKAFSMYREELASRLVSDGGVGGYSHLSRISKENREQITTEHPEIVSKIDNEVSTTNDFLQEILEPQRIKTDVQKQDMLLSVIVAKAFAGLKNNLQEMEEVIKAQPVREIPLQKIDEQTKGWGSV